MKLFRKILFILILILPVCIFSQDDDSGKEPLMEQVDWEVEWDANVQIYIRQKLYAEHLDSLKDTLASILKYKDNLLIQKESELYALIGATKEDVNNFRKKFEETEKKINGKVGTPDDWRKNYFDEITASKIRCLPEFSDRYNSMKSKFNFDIPTIPGNNYTVVKGDCLWKISKLKYNNPLLWPAIWDVNRNGIVNKEKFTYRSEQMIVNPNLIYPGQILKIPVQNSKEFNEALEHSKIFRKTRKKAQN